MCKMKKEGIYSAINALEKKSLVESRLVLKERLTNPRRIRIVKAVPTGRQPKEIGKDWEIKVD